MPRYTNVDELPVTIQDMLPPEAQERYLQIYNETWDEYSQTDTGIRPETIAHSLAWDTVEKEYVQVKVGDSKQWYRRGEEPTVEEIGASNRGLLDRIKSIF